MVTLERRQIKTNKFTELLNTNIVNNQYINTDNRRRLHFTPWRFGCDVSIT
jgi:hypothetical protein